VGAKIRKKTMLAKSRLYQEIHEQPEAVGRFLEQQQRQVRELAAVIRRQQLNHIVIVARGTSDNAGRYAKYVLGGFNQLTVALATPSLFTIYESPPRFGQTLVLGISQSGKSRDLQIVLEEAQRQGTFTAVMTNAPNSELATCGDMVIDLLAGPEKAVAATKTYTTELAAIALLSATLADRPDMLAALQHVPAAMAAALQMNDMIADLAPRFRFMQHAVVIGRGYNYATAFELALKLKELTYTIVEPYSSADFLHGPLALVEPGFPVFVLAPSGRMQVHLQEFLQTLQQHRAEVIAISDVNEALALAQIGLTLPVSVPEWLSPLTTIIPGQLLAMHLAHVRGLDVDHPRGIQKVTETL
jgi:glucosamine--fructose-6-phosphate aminotransferase (isomerizing)